MEAEKSPTLSSANRRPIKAGGVIHFESKSLRTKVAEGVNPSLRTGDEMAHLKQSGRKRG